MGQLCLDFMLSWEGLAPAPKLGSPNVLAFMAALADKQGLHEAGQDVGSSVSVVSPLHYRGVTPGAGAAGYAQVPIDADSAPAVRLWAPAGTDD